MTKLRPPLSFENALVRVAERIGWARVAELAKRDERTVRYWSDPDVATGITFDVGLQLDVECQAVDGTAPFLQTYQARLKVETAEDACRARLRDATAHAARESGEAFASLVEATAPGVHPLTLEKAKREVVQARNAFDDVLPHLRGPGVPPPRMDSS